MPDDAKLISDDLSIDESALTGMSFPEEKEGADIVYFGSVVRRDKAKRVVVNTGVNTYFGKTAELVKVAKPWSHREEIVSVIVKYMMHLGILASLAVKGLLNLNAKHNYSFPLTTFDRAMEPVRQSKESYADPHGMQR